MALVHRFYDVWDGAVTVGGYDVRDVTQDSLGEQVAMVLQEPFLFFGVACAIYLVLAIISSFGSWPVWASRTKPWSRSPSTPRNFLAVSSSLA